MICIPQCNNSHLVTLAGCACCWRENGCFRYYVYLILYISFIWINEQEEEEKEEDNDEDDDYSSWNTAKTPKKAGRKCQWINDEILPFVPLCTREMKQWICLPPSPPHPSWLKNRCACIMFSHTYWWKDNWVQCLNRNRALTVPDTAPNGIEFVAVKVRCLN